MTAKKDLKKRIRERQAKTGESYTTARMHIIRERESLLTRKNEKSDRMTAVILKCNDLSLRIRDLGREEQVTFRCSSYDAWKAAPGQLIEISPRRTWTWAGNPYLSGKIEKVWTDIEALNLEPLPLTDEGVVDLEEIYEPFEPGNPYYEMWTFFASSPRRDFEFHEIAWGGGVGVDPDDCEACLVEDAAEIVAQDPTGARNLLMQALLADLRCIDAHVHLGNLEFNTTPEYALVHYDIAVKIGELSLGPNFDSMLLWGHIYNRPFLRALHGYGLCLWRLGQLEKALKVFERILSLNPPDNQGVRFLWDDIRRGRPWRADEESDALHGGFSQPLY